VDKNPRSPAAAARVIQGLVEKKEMMQAE